MNQIEESVKFHLEKNHLKEKRSSIYLVLEDMDFIWEFDVLWKRGDSLQAISERFKRTEDEVALLIMDRCRQGYIEPRENGLKG